MNRTMLFRLVAVMLGFMAALLVSEGLLQIASALIKSRFARDDLKSVNGQIRILCVGESTTAGLQFGKPGIVEPWPAQLQSILNGAPGPGRVRVFNQGIIGVRTNAVADRIEGWLDHYQPQAVIAMLGINDEGNILVYRNSGSRSWLAEKSKTVQLLALLWRTAFDLGLQDDSVEELPGDGPQTDSETSMVLTNLLERRQVATHDLRLVEIIEVQHEIITADPGTPFYHLSLLRRVILEFDPPHEIDEFFSSRLGVPASDLTFNERLREIASWSERTGNRFAGLRLAASVTRAEQDADTEYEILSQTLGDPYLEGLAMLRRADFASRWNRREELRRCLLRADDSLPDDYAWSLLLGDVCFRMSEYDLAAKHFDRALSIRPDLPADHELLVLGWLASASDLAGDSVRAADSRSRIDALQLGRFREFTRFHYCRVVDAVRARGIPFIAMQYPLLPVESLQKLLDYREDVVYVENRVNFEAALHKYGYRELFTDRFAGSFGHLYQRGNELIAENVADAVARVLPEPDPRLQTPHPRP